MFRLLLALLVVVSHVSRIEVGRIAVLLFFLLSGFWVALIWDRKFTGHPVWQFYLSRYLRIVPLYLLMLAALSLAGHAVGARNLLLLGLANSRADPIGTAWSLDIELQFYLALPLLMPLAQRHFLLAMIGALLLAAMAWGLGGALTVINYLPAFLIGVGLYVHKVTPSHRSAVASLAMFAAFTVLLWAWPTTHGFIDKKSPDPFNIDVFSFIWLLPLLPYLTSSLHRPSSPLDRHLGNISYPLYLVHYPLIAALAGPDAPLMLKAAVIGLACILALMLYVFFDRPIELFRERLTNFLLTIKS